MTLFATNADGTGEITKSGYITVNNIVKPIAAFSADITSVEEGGQARREARLSAGHHPGPCSRSDHVVSTSTMGPSVTSYGQVVSSSQTFVPISVIFEPPTVPESLFQMKLPL